ncbi:MAG TPA: CinA family protein [Dehalococcoidia bacterium]|nr:CinA family protein [Dehalococcoidia bacterium]
MPFLTPEQQALATEIARALTERGETVAVAESTAGGLVSAALLWVPGASRYYRGGGVLYTRQSRIAMAGMTPQQFENYRGATLENVAAMAQALRQRLEATWCIAEAGTAGPTGGQPGRTVIAVSGPVSRSEVFETGSADREANMVAFATRSLEVLLEALR